MCHGIREQDVDKMDASLTDGVQELWIAVVGQQRIGHLAKKELEAARDLVNVRDARLAM